MNLTKQALKDPRWFKDAKRRIFFHRAWVTEK